MTSERKITANQSNALASTGPRTASGKARASCNSKKHGVSLSVLVDPLFFNQLQSLGKEIAGEHASAKLMEPACRIAAAQIDLVRVRQVRNGLLSEATAILFNENFVSDQLAKPHQVIGNLISRLTPLDRYERRALSRRKRAIRDFDLCRLDDNQVSRSAKRKGK